MLLTQWHTHNRNTYDTWTPLLAQIDNMFSELVRPTSAKSASMTTPANYELQETSDAYQLSFDIPGVHRQDLDIEVQGSRLMVAGERKPPHGRQPSAAPQGSYGRFQHFFTIPEGVKAESIEAHCENGVLMLQIRKPAAILPTKIKIKSDQEPAGFLKSLVKDKKPKDTVTVKQEQTAIAS